MKKINLFQTEAENLETTNEDITMTEPGVNPDLFTKEEFQIVGSGSPFKQ